MTFEEAVKKVDLHYREIGFLGIAAAGDTGKEWVFAGKAEGKPAEIEFDNPPVFVDKETGRLWTHYAFNREERKRIQKAMPVALPEWYTL